MENNFKPFDKVLVRNQCFDNGAWIVGLYSHYSVGDGLHYCVGLDSVVDSDILPYEGDEHLVGTNDEPKEEIKIERGEWVLVCDTVTSVVERWSLRQFDGCRNGHIYAFNNAQAGLSGWNYAIRFSDFNPNDMEETQKHILCVWNGKIVKL